MPDGFEGLNPSSYKPAFYRQISKSAPTSPKSGRRHGFEGELCHKMDTIAVEVMRKRQELGYVPHKSASLRLSPRHRPRLSSMPSHKKCPDRLSVEQYGSDEDLLHSYHRVRR